MTQNSVLDKYSGRFSPQDPRETRQIEIVPNPTADEICKRYEAWMQTLSTVQTHECRDSAKNHLEGLGSYTANDVRDFSIRLKKYDSENWHFTHIGTFLAGLIELCPDEEFEIITEHLENRIDNVGFQNKKRIYVRGDVGHLISFEMEGYLFVSGNAGNWIGNMLSGGKIEISGDAGSEIGTSMKSGEIIIGGNVENRIGSSMRGGVIKVYGNAGKHIGGGMDNGEISIDGEIEAIEDSWAYVSFGGRIYNKGVLVRGVEE